MASAALPPHIQPTTSFLFLSLRRPPLEPSPAARRRNPFPFPRRPTSLKTNSSVALRLNQSPELHLSFLRRPSIRRRPSTDPASTLAKQIHARLLKFGFACHTMLSEKLANLWLHEPTERSALKVFDEMPLRAAKLCASIIGVFARLAMWSDVLDVFVLMVGEGLRPDKFLLPKILKACSEVDDARLGAAVHGQIVKAKDLGMDVYLGNSLVDMYISLGNLELSREVFARMPDRDVVSWTTLVTGYFSAGLMDDAFEIFKLMKGSGIEPDLISWNVMISGFARNGDLEIALDYMEEMKERGLKPDACTWNGLISGCAQSWRFEDALDAFFRMLAEEENPNSVTFTSVLTACSGMKALSLGKQLHAYAFKCGFASNVYVCGSVMDMYFKCGVSGNSERVFMKMENKSSIMWNEMIATYAAEGKMDEALFLVQAMAKDGSDPDLITYNTILTSMARSGQKEETISWFREMCCKGFKPNIVSMNTLIAGFQQCMLGRESLQLFRLMQVSSPYSSSDDDHFIRSLPGDVLNEVYHPDSMTLVSALTVCANRKLKNQGKEIHAFVMRRCLDYNVVVSSALVNMYGNCSNIDLAARVFYYTGKKNTVTWNSLMTGYNSSGKPEVTLGLFIDMLEGGLVPSPITLMIVLLACSNVAALNLGRELHGFLLKNMAEELPVNVLSSLVGMYAKCGSLTEARLVFDRTLQKDLGCWNTIISCYSLHGCAIDAILLFERMKESGVEPDHATFGFVLSACSHGELVDEGRKYFSSMTTCHGITPTLKHFTYMVGIMGSAGLLEEAVDFIKGIPMELDACLWATLLRYCKLHSNDEIGEMAAKKLSGIEPSNTSDFILLYNIYAMAGLWKSATDIQKTSRACGLQIIKERSWINIHNSIHTFEAGDRPHPEIDRILDAWYEVAQRMENDGCVPEHPLLENDRDLNPFSCFHSEKLAILFGLISLNARTPIVVSKNLRMCIDCHTTAKWISRFYGRVVAVNDGCFFHDFRDGGCSCKDKW